MLRSRYRASPKTPRRPSTTRNCMGGGGSAKKYNWLLSCGAAPGSAGYDGMEDTLPGLRQGLAFRS